MLLYQKFPFFETIVICDPYVKNLSISTPRDISQCQRFSAKFRLYKDRALPLCKQLKSNKYHLVHFCDSIIYYKLLRSLIYIRDTSGPSVEPWGTPHLKIKGWPRTLILSVKAHYLLYQSLGGTVNLHSYPVVVHLL